MKKTLLLVLSIFLCSTMILSGCGDKGLKNNPKTNDPVISNGGLTVTKGDYLYFVNGFNSYEGLTKDVDNVWGKQVISAIYRTKITNNTIGHDENGFLSSAEVVVPQIVGTENASFYIFGDYIYYATPNMQKDKQGNLLNSRSNLCRVNINGTNNKVLYTTESTITNLNWSMYDLDGTVYMLVNDNNKIISINANSAKTKVIAKNTTSTAFINLDKYIKNDNSQNKTINGVNNYIYYTRDITEDDSEFGFKGNILARVNINGGNEEIVSVNNSFSYKINTVKNGCLYYTKTNLITSIATLCKYKLSETSAFVESNETEITNVSYTKTLILDANNENYIGTDVLVVDSSNNVLLINNVNNQKTIKTLYSTSNAITSIGLYGDLFFFTENSKIYYLNARLDNVTPTEIVTDSKTIKTDVNNFFDYDGRNAYYYASYTAEDGTAHYYLNRTDLTASEPKSEFIGVFAKDHTPEKPEEDSDEIWIK